VAQDPSPSIAPAEAVPLRSVHTSNFPLLLEELGISLVVSTYQAGKVLLVRSDSHTLNTHFRSFDKPMGLAVSGHRLAIGTTREIWEFHNVPAVCNKLTPPGRHDACYLPRIQHVTGDIQVHELAWAGDALWLINTRFSCLCTLDRDYSFVPRWRPPFVSAFAPEDRCHLNGLSLVEGKPRYVTGLAASDEREGWRAKKRDGGFLMEVESNRLVTDGLSMPHSPRWYDGRLWLLESGKGGFGRVDPRTGRYESLAQLPGFTRGLALYGKLAFIGLSQVRESAVFGDLELTQRLTERTCGVWVVHIDSGRTVAFLKFEDAVQEIFSVEVLSGVRYPELVDDTTLIGASYVLPDEALGEVDPSFRNQPAAVSGSRSYPPKERNFNG
jgi:uncharacterized protein (TIGR03032 family)